MTDWKTKLFDSETEYDSFLSDLALAVRNDGIPYAVTMENLDGITLDEIEECVKELNDVSDLETEAIFYVCNRCNKLHMMLLFDWPDEDEDEDEPEDTSPQLYIVKEE